MIKTNIITKKYIQDQERNKKHNGTIDMLLKESTDKIQTWDGNVIQKCDIIFLFVKMTMLYRYNRAYNLRVGSDFVGVKLNIILVSVPLKGTFKWDNFYRRR